MDLDHAEWCRFLARRRLLAPDHRPCVWAERCQAWQPRSQPWRYQRRRSSLPSRGAVPHLPEGVTVDAPK